MVAHPEVELIDMGVGEPDEGAFPDVVECLAKEAGKWENRTYADNGIMAFREAVAQYMRSQYDVELDPKEEICHAVGSKNALSMIPAAFINPGDMSLVTLPGYPVMGTHTRYYGGDVCALPLLEERGFLPNLDDVPAHVVAKAKLLYLNYPNNPTGAVATSGFYDKVIDFALENGILVVSDAAYAPLTFGERPLSILSRPRAKETCVELHSMSKGFNMTGWRLSWVCGSSLAVKAFASVKDNFDSGQFRAIQLAAAKALEKYSSITSKIVEKYSRRLEGLTAALGRVGFNARKPGGSFYLYVQAPREVQGGPVFESAEEVSEYLIRKALVSTVPWDDAGPYLRFSVTFVAKSLEEEQRVLAEVERRLDRRRFLF